MNTLLLIAVCFISVVSASYDFGVADNSACTHYGWAVEGKLRDAARCANDLVWSRRRSAIRKALRDVPVPAANADYAHVSYCTTKDIDGDDQHFVNYVMSNSSTHEFVNDCPIGGRFFTASVLLRPLYNATGIVRSDAQGPLAGAIVTVHTDSGDVNATTAADGSYVLALKNGTYTATGYAFGHLPTEVTIVVGGNTVLSDIELTKIQALYVTVSHPTRYNDFVQPFYLIKGSNDFTFEGCQIYNDGTECPCVGHNVTAGAEGTNMLLENIEGCGQPGVFVIGSYSLEDDADVEVKLYHYKSSTTPPTTQLLRQWTRNTATIRHPINWVIWRVWSLTHVGFTYHDEVVPLLQYYEGVPGWTYQF